jgi:WD40 repeat protein
VGGEGIAQAWDATNGHPFGPPIKLQTGYPVILSFSADGNYLATVSELGADVWDLSAHDNRKVFSTTSMDEAFPCTPLSSFVFSPSGKYAAAACRGRVRIWDIATWRPMVTIPEKPRPGLRPPLHPIAFSPDSKYLASADDIHEVATGALLQSLYSQSPVSAEAFSQDGQYLAMAAGDVVRLVNTYDGVSFAQLRHRREIRAIAISPPGGVLATAGKDNTARLWQVDLYAGNTHEIMRVSHEGEVSSVAFSPDGMYLATASEDGTVRVWQASTIQKVGQKIYESRDEPVVAVSSTGRFLAVSAGRSVLVRNVVDGREIGRLAYEDNSGPNLEIADGSLSQDGQYLWAAVREKRRNGGHGARPEIQKIARVWDVSRGEVVATIKYEGAPGSAVFSPDTRRLVVEDGTTLRILEVPGGGKVASVKLETVHAAPLFSPNGAYLAIIESKALRLLETNGWREVRNLPISEGTLPFVAFSPGGEYIAAGSSESIKIWEVAGSSASKSLPVKYTTRILFAPDGKYIAIANWNYQDSSDRSVLIWDDKAQREVDRIRLLDIERAATRDNSPTQLAFTINGRYLAFENQGVLRVWDMLTRRKVERWTSQDTTQLTFSPDAKYLLSGPSVWSWGPDAIIAEACDRLARNLEKAEWRQYFGAEAYRKTCPTIQ